MVRTAIKNKTEADQLEECDLTFKDLHLIEDAFVKILLARFHSRIEYLKEESTEGTDDSQVPIAYGTRKRSTVDNSIEGE
jgi:hypothetical protein